MKAITRMPPWDLRTDLWAKLHMIKVRDQRPWRWMLSKGVELFIAWYEEEHGEIMPLLPAAVLPAAGLPAAGLPTQNMEVLPAIAPVVSVPPVEKSEALKAAEKEVARWSTLIRNAQSMIEPAKARLLIEPEHIPSLTVMRVNPPNVARWEVNLVEAQRVLDAELSSIPIDNWENQGEI